MSTQKSILILGAGFAGTTVAHLMKGKGFDITVLEYDKVPGGGCRTRWIGGHPYTFGPRIFFSRDDEVNACISSLVKIRQFFTKSYTYVEKDSALYNYPLQYSDLPKMPDYKQIEGELSERKGKTPSVNNFEDYWISAIGPSLYSKFVDDYSKKMWGIESNKNLSAEFEWVNRGTPIRDGDTRLYTDQFQGYPENEDGYNQFFDKALAGVKYIPESKVEYFDWDRRVVHASTGKFEADIIVNTLPVDYLFRLTYGKLQYCGRKFIPFVLPVSQALPDDATWIHYSGNETFTRITEFKKITTHKSPHTLLGMEIPDNQSRYYPVQSYSEKARFQKYQEMFPKNFYSIGRHGSFKYKGIPDAIRDALDVKKQILS
ncbi:MAG: NAD(P)-binding protein [Deltaproteobacteria bacterium]|nr:NAD(P)-binding protein [Deltaproteobacteria bacterium]